MLSKLLAVAALCAAGLTGFAFDPPEYNGSFTRQGVSYAQRGGLGARDYVVTNIVVNGQPRPLPPYLYLMELDDTYPDDAEWYYQHADYRDGGHCSVRRSGNTVERNYDWHFDDAATFVLKVGGAEGRFASVGVANVGTNLTDGFVRSGAWSRYYKCLAGHTTDGINENGLVAEVNVTSGSWGRTSGAVHGLGAVRWALDHGTNAQQAAEFLAANVYLPQGFGVNFHYLIADATKTYIVENCEAHEVTAMPAVMTNFNLDRQGGEGYERYASLTNGATIESQWWTLAYNPATRPVRSSDLGGEAAQIWAAWNDGRTKEQHRGESFGGVTWWQTVHCSKYDIQTLTLRIAVQEIPDWYAFTVPTVGKVKSVNGRVGEVVLDAAAVNALPDNKDELVGNDNFKEAVATVSPPVELPAKWALANVTNAYGGAVAATNINAMPLVNYIPDVMSRSEVNAEDWYLTLADTVSGLTSSIYGGLSVTSRDENGNIDTLVLSPWSVSTRGFRHKWSDIALETNVLSKTDAQAFYLSKADADTDYLKKTDAGTTYLSKSDANTTYLKKVDAQTIYETKGDATAKLAEAKAYSDAGIATVTAALGNKRDIDDLDIYEAVYDFAAKSGISGRYTVSADDYNGYRITITLNDDDVGKTEQHQSYEAALAVIANHQPLTLWRGVGDWEDVPAGTVFEWVERKVDEIATTSKTVPVTRKINGVPLTQDITIQGMPTTGLVWSATAVKTANGAKTIGAADVGAVSDEKYSQRVRGTGFAMLDDYDNVIAEYSKGYIYDNDYGTYMEFPRNEYGVIALNSWSSLRTMLADANTNQNADCECISTNICKLAAPAITNAVIYTRDRFYDAELDVTWKRTVSGGRIFYDIEAVGNSTEE